MRGQPIDPVDRADDDHRRRTGWILDDELERQLLRFRTSFEPTPEGWQDDDRGMLCVISTENAATALTGSVRDSGR